MIQESSNNTSNNTICDKSEAKGFQGSPSNERIKRIRSAV